MEKYFEVKQNSDFYKKYFDFVDMSNKVNELFKALQSEIPLASADGMDDGEELCMNNNWKSKNRHKYLLQYHLIFVCKYRKKLFLNKLISDDIKQFSYEICSKHNVTIHEMETDKDHIHYMIETEPNINEIIYYLSYMEIT